MEQPPEMQQDNQCSREPRSPSPPSPSPWLLTVPSSACCDRRWAPAGPGGTPSVSAADCSWSLSTCFSPWCSPPGRGRWWPGPWGTWTWPGTSGSQRLHPPSPRIAFCSPAMEMLLTTGISVLFVIVDRETQDRAENCTPGPRKMNINVKCILECSK